MPAAAAEKLTLAATPTPRTFQRWEEGAALAGEGAMPAGSLEEVAAWTREMVEILSERLGAPRMQKVLLRMNGLSLPNIPNYGFTDFGMMSTNDLVTLEPVLAEGSSAELTGGCMHDH